MRKEIMTWIALSSLMAATASAGSFAEDFSRKGKFEAYGFAQAMKISNLFFSDADVYGGGIGLGYNISDHFTVNGDFSISAVKTHYALFSFSVTEHTTLYLGNVSLDYNILRSRVTPVISAGAGLGLFATEDSSGTFDPNIGAGVRWDASDHLFLKAMVRGWAWDVTDRTEGAVSVSLAVGYKF
jgi:hypothetical protein